MRKINKAYLNTTLSRSVSPYLHSSFWKLFCWGKLVRHQYLLGSFLLRKAGQTPMLTGKFFCWGRLDKYQCLLGAQTPMLTRSSSAEEGWTDTNVTGSSVLRKAGQTPMLTGKLLCWGRLDRHQCLLGAQTPMLTRSSSAEEGWTDTNVTGSSVLRKAGQTPMLTGKLLCWGRLDRHQCLLGALLLRKAGQTPMLTGKLLCWERQDRHQCLLGSSSAEEGWTDTNVLRSSSVLRKAGQTPMLTGKLLCWERQDRHQCLLGSSSAEEGWTDTNAYWEALLLRKAGQTPMLTGKLFCWGRLDRHQCYCELCAEEGWTDANAYWEAPLLRKAGQTPMLTGSSDTNAYQELFCWGRLDRHQCYWELCAEEGWTDANAHWEAPLLRKAGQTPMLTGSSSPEEGWTDTNAYWEAPLLRKAGQTPMLTRKLLCWGRLDRHQCSAKLLCAEEGWADTNAYWEAPLLRKTGQTPMLTGKLLCWGGLDRHQCLLGSTSAEEGWTDTNAYWEALLLRKAGQTPMLTVKLLCWGRLDRHQCLLENILNPFALRKVSLLDRLLCYKFCRYREP